MDDAVPPAAAPKRRARQPRQATTERRAEILRAAANTFGSKGYKNGSLAEVAEQVGITHAGVLHHFGSKEQLLVEVLEYRDKEDVRDLEGQHIPGGLGLFQHLVRTARMNVDRPGIVQGYSVLTGESVTENHPARAWVTDRFRVLRGEISDAVIAVGEGTVSRETADCAASAIIGVMDGLQVQWLLDEDVDLPTSTQFAIEAILAAALLGDDRPHPLD
ncbi:MULTISPECIES: TetR/AcrR family transcriptional regulator [unclassified Cellulomonas]|uniref:TetR/AcrR family transcriptional regulator n=1 Tax=Cellulomonas sp. Root137 TaxID=1736459 RepID=UPI0006F55B6B|nr:TetR family transcriptional regulator [Cellulomonas sp. Root137]KRD43263.1 TetR family transcriptional regulator [Cellulomonas sp. Root930]